MPSFPEILDRHRLIGRIEIFRDCNTEHFSHTDGHVRIAAEVEIKLQRIEAGCQKG